MSKNGGRYLEPIQLKIKLQHRTCGSEDEYLLKTCLFSAGITTVPRVDHPNPQKPKRELSEIKPRAGQLVHLPQYR